MLDILPSNKIYIYNHPIDMRKQINGLMILTSQLLNKNPSDGNIYIFYNKSFDKLKLLYFSNGGFCLFYKRMESSKFILPKIDDNYYSLTMAELRYLLDGLNLELLPKTVQNNYNIFC